MFQYGSGADLALLLTEVMNEAKTQVSQENIGISYALTFYKLHIEVKMN